MTPIDLLREIVTQPGQKTYEWLHILGALWELEKSDRVFTAEEIEVLKLASVFEGDVLLTHCYDGPHSAPPDEMIRRAAKHLLGEPDEFN